MKLEREYTFKVDENKGIYTTNNLVKAKDFLLALNHLPLFINDMNNKKYKIKGIKNVTIQFELEGEIEEWADKRR